MNKKPEITEATKAKLKDAFWELYTKKSIEHISVKEITDLAGYNRGTFYLYYKDVYDMLAQIEGALMEELTSIIYSNSNTSPEELKDNDIHQFLSSIIDLYERNKKYIMVLFSDHGDPKFRSDFKKNIIEFRKNYGVKHNLPNSAYQDYLLEFYISGILSMIAKWFENGNDIPVEEMLLLLMIISVRTGVIPYVKYTIEGLPEYFPKEYQSFLEQFHF